MVIKLKSILFFLSLFTIAYADTVTDLIDKREQFEKQKEVFEKLEKRQDEKFSSGIKGVGAKL